MLDVTGRVISGERTEVFVAVAVRASDRGSRSQTLSSEMLHWDAYRAQRNINDGVATMVSLFGKGAADGLDDLQGERTFRVKEKLYSMEKVIATSPAYIGSSLQTLCAEMIHWDDLRMARGLMPPGEQPLAQRFRPQAASRKYQLYDTAKGKLETVVTKNVAALVGGPACFRYCAEMEHFDDYCSARGIAQASTMRKLFGTR